MKLQILVGLELPLIWQKKQSQKVLKFITRRKKTMKKIYLVLMVAAALFLFSGCVTKSNPNLELSPCACLEIPQFQG
jgi:uncharacterized lipoprotein YajG